VWARQSGRAPDGSGTAISVKAPWMEAGSNLASGPATASPDPAFATNPAEATGGAEGRCCSGGRWRGRWRARLTRRGPKCTLDVRRTANARQGAYSGRLSHLGDWDSSSVGLWPHPRLRRHPRAGVLGARVSGPASRGPGARISGARVAKRAACGTRAPPSDQPCRLFRAELPFLPIDSHDVRSLRNT
jgi:hypothetical protein